MAPYITSKFDRFVKNHYLRPILNARRSAIDFEEIIDGKIFVANLAKGVIGALNARDLVSASSERCDEAGFHAS